MGLLITKSELSEGNSKSLMSVYMVSSSVSSLDGLSISIWGILFGGSASVFGLLASFLILLSLVCNQILALNITVEGLFLSKVSKSLNQPL